MSELQENNIVPDVSRHKRGFLHEAWDIAKVLAISLIIVIPIRYFIVQPFIVRGASMEPNFYESDYLVIDEMSFYFRSPLRGEVIVFRYPRDTRQFFIKRIVALPGERVNIRNGRVKIINSDYPKGFVLSESYLIPQDRPTYPEVEISLGDDEFFVLGDNRDASSDSRVWGPLSKKFVMGRALFRAWPINGFGVLVQPPFLY